ncbi:MAG TPA: SRPBCC family protein [Dehalococcoidia bacterium]|nr:SRPBCC family protein [Dehalococcoidia bacterium]
MHKIENSAEINNAPETVIKYLWNVNNLPNYLPISKVKVLEKREGHIRLSHKLAAARMNMNLVCDFRKLENDTKLEYQTIKGMSVHGSWLCQPTDKGTNLTYTLEYEPPGWIFGTILDKLVIAKEMNRISVEALQKLTDILRGRETIQN